MHRTNEVRETKTAAALPHGIQSLVEAIGRRRPRSAEDAAGILADVRMEESDILPWADYSHASADSYGRQLVAEGEGFELMVMSWLPGDYSAIHDHGATQWGAVRYFGEADHVVFDESGSQLRIEERMTTHVGQVYPVTNSLIHLMGNPTDRAFLSVHLYGCELEATSVTAGARIFDLYERRIQRADGGVFYCLPEEEIVRRETCPAADVPTRLLHHGLMASRLQRMRGGTSWTRALDAQLRWLERELEALQAEVRTK